MQMSRTVRNSISVISGDLVSISIWLLVVGNSFLHRSSVHNGPQWGAPCSILLWSPFNLCGFCSASGAWGSLAGLGVPVYGGQWSPSKILPSLWDAAWDPQTSTLSKNCCCPLASSRRHTAISLGAPLNNFLKGWDLGKQKAEEDAVGKGSSVDWFHPSWVSSPKQLHLLGSEWLWHKSLPFPLQEGWSCRCCQTKPWT